MSNKKGIFFCTTMLRCSPDVFGGRGDDFLFEGFAVSIGLRISGFDFNTERVVN